MKPAGEPNVDPALPRRNWESLLPALLCPRATFFGFILGAHPLWLQEAVDAAQEISLVRDLRWAGETLLCFGGRSDDDRG